MFVAARSERSLFSGIAYQIKLLRQTGQKVCPAAYSINIDRIRYAAGFSIPMHAMFVLYFFISDNSKHPIISQTWRQGLIISHSAMLAVMIVSFLFASYLRKMQPNRAGYILPFVFTTIMLTGGLIITMVDQLIGAGILPYIIVTIITGTLVLLRPCRSIIFFTVNFLLFSILISQAGLEPAIIVSYRINALSISLVGFVLSLLMWRNQVQVVLQEEQIESQKQELSRLAFYDPLTGLANRRLFDELVNREITAMKKDNYISSLVIFDIDHFKKVNDRYGHIVGDDILKQLAGHVSKNIRSADRIARFGGEEFIILMPDTAVEEARKVAEKLRVKICEEPFQSDKHQINLTVSFGVSELSNLTQTDNHTFYAKADQALYYAKQAGRNRVEVHDGRPSPFQENERV